MRVKQNQLSINELREILIEKMCLLNVSNIQGRKQNASQLKKEIISLKKKINKADASAEICFGK